MKLPNIFSSKEASIHRYFPDMDEKVVKLNAKFDTLIASCPSDTQGEVEIYLKKHGYVLDGWHNILSDWLHFSKGEQEKIKEGKVYASVLEREDNPDVIVTATSSRFQIPPSGGSPLLDGIISTKKQVADYV